MSSIQTSQIWLVTTITEVWQLCVYASHSFERELRLMMTLSESMKDGRETVKSTLKRRENSNELDN
jgi:hypothetical protein